MPIIRRNNGDEEAGSNSGLSRPKKKIKKLNNDKKKRVELSGELAEVVNMWNKEAPGVIRPLSQQLSYGRVKTGILSVDLCLAGGFMRSRAGMVYGERSAGKTTLVSKAMKHALEREPDKHAIFIDIEGTADKRWMETLGVDIDRVMIVEPPTGENAVDQADALIRSEEVCFLALDSIAMLTPFVELDSSAEDQQIGLQARLIGKMLRRLNNAMLQERRREHYPTIIFLNQFRMKAGFVMGDPRTLPGG